MIEAHFGAMQVSPSAMVSSIAFSVAGGKARRPLACVVRRCATGEIGCSSPVPRCAAAVEAAAAAGKSATAATATAKPPPPKPPNSAAAARPAAEDDAGTSGPSHRGAWPTREPARVTSHDEDHENRGTAASGQMPSSCAACCLLRGAGMFSLSSRLADRRDAGRQPAVEIVLPEMRRDHVLQDALRLRIGQRALHAAPGLDAQPPQRRRIVFRHQQQHAVVDALAPQLPCIVDADAVLLDRFRRGRLDQQDRDLAAGALLRSPSARFPASLRWFGVEHAGLVGHARLSAAAPARIPVRCAAASSSASSKAEQARAGCSWLDAPICRN